MSAVDEPTVSAPPRVLFVDDEPLVLSGLRRALGGSYRLETAASGPEALALLAQETGEDPFAVVVSDMMMPVMNGAELLRRARLAEPDAVLIILSGQADLTSTVAAVNNAQLFRFLTKPCTPDDLRRAIDDAVRQRQLVLAERELLERTLSGAVDTLMKVLAMASPVAFGRADRVARLVEATAEGLGDASGWELRLAGLLSQVGCIAVPESIVERVRFGASLTSDELAIYATHPGVARDLLAGIPRLERVSEWIGSQPVGTGEPHRPAGPGSARPVFGANDHPLPRTVLHAAVAFLAARDAGRTDAQIADELAVRFPPAVVAALLAARSVLDTGGTARQVTLGELRWGMVLDQDVLTSGGMVLVRSGEQVDEALLARLRNFARSAGVVEPIRVVVPNVTADLTVDVLHGA